MSSRGSDDNETEVARFRRQVADFDRTVEALRRQGPALEVKQAEPDPVEPKLEQAKLLLEAVVDQSPTPLVAVTYPDLKVVCANLAAQDLLGVADRSAFMGVDLVEVERRRTWQEFLPDGTPLSLGETPIGRTLRGEVVTNEELLLVRGDGSRRWQMVSGRPLYDDSGALVAGIIAFPDITEQKLTEAALRESEQRLSLVLQAAQVHQLRFERLIQHSNDVIAVLDRDGVQRAIYGPLEAMLGYRPEELLGASGFDHVHPDDQEPVRRAFESTVRSPGQVQRVEYRYRRKDGAWANLEAVGTSLLDDPTVGGLVLNVREISERKHAEQERDKLQEQLQHAMKMEAVGRLAGGIAHDFNNLLTVIQGNVDMARMDLSPGDPLLQALGEIGKAAASASALTHQLLAFSRRQIIAPRVLNLNDLIASLQKMLGRLIGEDIRLVTRLSEDLGSTHIDPGQFEQVLANLVVNARDAMPNGGQLVVETRNCELDEELCARHAPAKAGAYVSLVVSDTGTGMSAEVKQHVFEPFFTTKPKGRGTGLGLATTFGIVRQAGGVIEVYSEPGTGTTFKIYLPRVDQPAQRLAQAKPALSLSKGHETILVVEDESNVRELTRSMLQRLGYDVLSAAHGAAALVLAEQHKGRIDLLMTDVVMPEINGRELAERLLTQQPGMKVLFTSGYTEDVIVHHGVLDQRLDFIGKPFTLHGLADKVREVLDRRR